MIYRALEFLADHFPKFCLGVAVLMLVLMLCAFAMGCTLAPSPTPTNVVTDRDGRQHEVIHSEFGAVVLP